MNGTYLRTILARKLLVSYLCHVIREGKLEKYFQGMLKKRRKNRTTRKPLSEISGQLSTRDERQPGTHELMGKVDDREMAFHASVTHL